MSAPRNHTTHHEDCGCLSALHASEVARLRSLLSEAQVALDWALSQEAGVPRDGDDYAASLRHAEEVELRIEEEVGRG